MRHTYHKVVIVVHHIDDRCASFDGHLQGHKFYDYIVSVVIHAVRFIRYHSHDFVSGCVCVCAFSSHALAQPHYITQHAHRTSRPRGVFTGSIKPRTSPITYHSFMYVHKHSSFKGRRIHICLGFSFTGPSLCIRSWSQINLPWSTSAYIYKLKPFYRCLTVFFERGG